MRLRIKRNSKRSRTTDRKLGSGRRR